MKYWTPHQCVLVFPTNLSTPWGTECTWSTSLCPMTSTVLVFQNASESDGWHGEAGSQQNHWLILVCVNHHQYFMKTCLLSPLLSLALKSLSGTHMMQSNFYKHGSCSLFLSPTPNTFLALILLDLTAAFEIIQVCSRNSISLSPLFPHSGLPLWGVFTVSFVELVSVGLRIKSKLSFFTFFLGHFMQIHSFNVASKCESAAQTSTLSTQVPLDLSFFPWPNWWSHTDTPKVLCSLLWQMVSPLNCINENLGIVLDSCPSATPNPSIMKPFWLPPPTCSWIHFFTCHCFRLSPLSPGWELPNWPPAPSWSLKPISYIASEESLRCHLCKTMSRASYCPYDWKTN